LIVLIGTVFLISTQIKAQDVPGCTDPQANNYSPEATVNDGSCTYDNTNYNPFLLYQLPENVNETSGLIYYKNSLWTINDSGNPPILYRVDSLDGTILQEITVSNATNVDWESLAQDDDYIYIGDFGNNNGDRDDLGIYKIAKSFLPDSGNGEVESEHISFVFSDYTILKGKWRDTDFDCEAMISVEDSLYLFSKDWVDNQTRLYRLAKTPGEQIAELQYTFNAQGLVTGADYNQEAKEITLIGYSENTYTPFLWLLFDYSNNQFFSGNKRRINMVSLFGAQTEGITYTNDKNGAISNEQNVLYQQSAFSIYTGEWTDTTTTGLNNSIYGTQDFVIKPNPISKGILTVKMKGFKQGIYQVELYNTKGILRQKSECELIEDNSVCNLKFPVDSLQSGIYFVRLISENVIIEKKFIKK